MVAATAVVVVAKFACGDDEIWQEGGGGEEVWREDGDNDEEEPAAGKLTVRRCGSGRWEATVAAVDVATEQHQQQEVSCLCQRLVVLSGQIGLHWTVGLTVPGSA